MCWLENLNAAHVGPVTVHHQKDRHYLLWNVNKVTYAIKNQRNTWDLIQEEISNGDFSQLYFSLRYHFIQNVCR